VLYTIDQGAEDGDSRRGEPSNQECLNCAFECRSVVGILESRRRIGRQLVMRDRLHMSEGIKEHNLTGLIGLRDLFRPVQRRGFGGKAQPAALRINYAPDTLVAGDYMYRVPCVN
jgi:hypothetical protein